MSETEDAGIPKISGPANDAVAVAGYTDLESLTQATAAELLALHGVGPKAIRILREEFAARGWSFRDE